MYISTLVVLLSVYVYCYLLSVHLSICNVNDLSHI